MGSSVVSREIRREVWPVLRQQGFDAFTSRTAWRHLPDRVWVVNFQSFSSYFSLVDGCTTFSFAMNIGIYLDALAENVDAKVRARPRDYHCHFRAKLAKGIHQQNYTRSDIWFVDPQGSNLLDVVDDARRVLLSEGMGWFDRLSGLDQVLELLVNHDETDDLFGIGAKWSPQRKLFIGRAAVAMGQEELRVRVLREAEAEVESIRLQFESIGRNGRRPGRSAPA